MEAAKLESVHSGLAGSDCGLRHPTSTLPPANATVPTSGRYCGLAGTPHDACSQHVTIFSRLLTQNKYCKCVVHHCYVGCDLRTIERRHFFPN
jgi:hypothetical protein